jgi:hypothetical protein
MLGYFNVKQQEEEFLSCEDFLLTKKKRLLDDSASRPGCCACNMILVDEHGLLFITYRMGITHVTSAGNGHPLRSTRASRYSMNSHPEAKELPHHMRINKESGQTTPCTWRRLQSRRFKEDAQVGAFAQDRHRWFAAI